LGKSSGDHGALSSISPLVTGPSMIRGMSVWEKGFRFHTQTHGIYRGMYAYSISWQSRLAGRNGKTEISIEGRLRPAKPCVSQTQAPPNILPACGTRARQSRRMHNKLSRVGGKKNRKRTKAWRNADDGRDAGKGVHTRLA
jgi:hypothetical protein